MHDATEQVTLAARLAAMRENVTRVFEEAGTAHLNYIKGPLDWYFAWLIPDKPGFCVPCHKDDAEQSIDAAQRKALHGHLAFTFYGAEGQDAVAIHRVGPAKMYPSLHAAYTAVFGDAREEAGDE